MPIQVSYGHISRADDIRQRAIASLERELSDVEETQTPSQPIARVSVRVIQPEPLIHQQTSLLGHIFTFVIFVALSFALFSVVTR
jgi:hypothetical protein